MPRQAQLAHLDPDHIDPNRDNPRLIFREVEMNLLLASIREVGIKVPLTVYPEGRRYVLIDGERRWRCALKLNLSDVPAIVQPKPDRLENILTMFNIHNVRTDWDLMPTALKLAEVRDLLAADGKPTRATDLAGVTGMSVPTVRRALDLLELPQKYQEMLLKEAEKPKDRQTITVDLFVEINKARRVIERYAPAVFEEVSPDEFVESMVDKYERKVINNVVRFREVSKIARAERAGGDSDEVAPVLVNLVRDPELDIETAYRETVSSAYEARDIGTRASSLADRLSEIRRASSLPPEVRAALEALRGEIDRLLES